MSVSDLELLAQYREQNSESAFAQLVERHVNLVYSAALRQVRSPQLAEEVAQTVFVELARNTGKLKPDTVLGAWLYHVTRCAALVVVRRESRRQSREQIATEINVMNAAAAADDWTQVEPLLDEAMHALDDADRAAVLLRYFENKTLREVGRTLGTSEDAAQKRVSRAVERLRQFFTKRGVTVGASGLVVILAAHAVQAAPAELTGAISTSAALAGTTLAATSTKIIAMTALQKTFIAAGLIVAVSAGIYEGVQASNLRDRNQQLQQQQAPLAEQVRKLQDGLDEAARQVAALRDENTRLNSNTAELLRLRGEVPRLKADAQELARVKNADTDENSTATAKAWTAKVVLLKSHLERNPDEAIPEMRFITERDWLNSIDPTAGYWPLKTDKDYERAMYILRDQAQMRFCNMLEEALRKFYDENKRFVPADLAQLHPYLDPAAAEIVAQQYEMVPADKLAASAIPGDSKVDGEWMIARKTSIRGQGSRIAIVPLKSNGHTHYQETFF